MTYETPQALRMALEQRLRNQSLETGVGLDRLRRRVVFERVVSRLHTADPGLWVLKGGMALEVRLRDEARLTKDIDLGLREQITERDQLQERLVEALGNDPYGDGFVITTSVVTALMEDDSGHRTWRSSVAAQLAGKPFGTVQLDISPRGHELAHTDVVPLPNSLAFAGIETPSVEIIDVHRHAAEKYHAMLKDFGDRENSRVRDLVDLVILVEHELLDSAALASAIEQVWLERNGSSPPATLLSLPATWPDRYEKFAADHDLAAARFSEAVHIVTDLWTEMFPNEEA